MLTTLLLAVFAVFAVFAAIVLVVFLILSIWSPMRSEFFDQNYGEFKEDFRRLWSKQQFELRASNWKKHVDVYAQLKSTAAAGSPGAMRIDYLSSDRLRILDAKFSTLLQVQTLLGVMMTITTNRFWNQLLAASRNWWGVLLGVPFVLWFLTIAGCLIAVGNIRWGDLWKIANPVDAEEDYVNTLVKVVIVRTAMLRVLSAVALANLFLFTLAVACLLLLAQRPEVHPPASLPSIGKLLALPVPKFARRSWDNPSEIDPLKKQLSENAKNGDLLLLIGSADCVPSRKPIDNYTLAFNRASEVSNRLQNVVGVPDIRVLPQYDHCQGNADLRAVYPFLIRLERDDK
jgi:hypothetical protein